jgi:pSer/pThr/pTyr-binding forkhead associated (FHA) protein
MKQVIRLRGFTSDVKGKVWEFDTEVLRVGKLSGLELVLEDASVSRNHAEFKAGPDGWTVRDLGSTNGTFVNGMRLETDERPLRSRDIVQFGKTAMMVDWNSNDDPDTPREDNELTEALTPQSWEAAVDAAAFDRNRGPRPGESLLALLRAAQHLAQVQDETELLHAILTDVVAVLDAQRAVIVLRDRNQNPYVRAATGDAAGRSPFSPALVEQCVRRGKSILCPRVKDDPELSRDESMADGTMASVLCVLLRTPRQRLGALHLDRAVGQVPFTEENLHLAAAVAAVIAASIESAQLRQRQNSEKP